MGHGHILSFYWAMRKKRLKNPELLSHSFPELGITAVQKYRGTESGIFLVPLSVLFKKCSVFGTVVTF